MKPEVSPLDVYDAAYFDGLFAASPDPWGFESRWYEHRKRALTLACLPSLRYRYGYEPGCANGELSAALADRCDRLLVSDGAEKAVVTVLNKDSIEVALGGDRYRLPATVHGKTQPKS